MINFVRNHTALVIALTVVIVAGMSTVLYKKIQQKISRQIEHTISSKLENIKTISNTAIENFINNKTESEKLFSEGAASAINELLFRVDSMTRQNDFLIQSIDREIANSSDNTEKVSRLSELCHIQIEEAYDSSRFAQGYHCLANSYLKIAERDNINLFKSIQNISFALETEYKSDYAEVLYQAIIYDQEDMIPKELFGQKKSSIVENSSEEIKYLNQLISLNIPGVTNRAQYRLSYIYQNGRSSAIESVENINYFEALKNRNLAIKAIDIKRTNNIDIALIFDNYYAPHSATTIASVLLNSEPDTYHRFYIIEDPKNSLSQETRDKLSSLQYIKEYSINFIKFPDELIKDFKTEQYTSIDFPKVTVYRIFLSKFLNLSRILYLDGDLVVTRDLVRLFNVKDMSNSFFAAALEGSAFELSKLRPNCYQSISSINSGVLLLNLEEMRKYDLLDMITSMLNKSKCPCHYMDQDFINLTFSNKIKLISSKWNNGRNDNKFQGMFIQHYNSRLKPWRWPGEAKSDEKISLEMWKKKPESFPLHFKLYWYYRDLTPWTTKPDELQKAI